MRRTNREIKQRRADMDREGQTDRQEGDRSGQVRSGQDRSLQIAQANRKRRFKSRAVFASY
jgi:hypothetical protein